MADAPSVRGSQNGWWGATRAALSLLLFLAFTLPLMPVQAVLLALSARAARTFPHWYHRQVCKLLGIRLHIAGAVPQDRPVLLVSNHVSWLDIVVVSAVAPVSFVAKKEVASWPFVSWLAKLQQTVFVDRNRRTSVGHTTNEMIARLHKGATLVLFAEGTSSDGARVLPFRTSLFAAAKPTSAVDKAPDDAVVQTMALVYTHFHGVPLSRADRPTIGWYGDMDMGGHAWTLLGSGPIDVQVRLGEPVPLDQFPDRKALAKFAEDHVRADVAALLRGRTGAADRPAA